MNITRKGFYTIVGPDGLSLLNESGQERRVTSRDEAYERITEDGRGGLFTIKCPDRTVRVIGSVADQGAGDTEAPTVPTGLTATAINKNQIDLLWQASTDNVAVSGYQVFRDGNPIDTVNSPTVSYSDTAVSPSTLYSYTVAAYDAAGNTSAESGADTATTPANAAPTWTAIPDQDWIIGNSVSIDLDDFADDLDVETLTYSIVTGTLAAGLSLSGSVISGTPTTSGETDSITVRADDGNDTADDTFVFTTYDADVTAPPVPTGLAETSTGSNSASLSWNASTDAAGSANEFVSGTASYRLYRDSSLITTVSSPTLVYSDTGLSASTQYSYTISAVDVEGNESAQSSAVLVTTDAAGSEPDLPQVTPDSTYPTITGSTITVNSGDNLQTAINSANLGDEIVIEAGATFTGPFTLPDKGAGTDWIVIRSANSGSLPAGTRVGPADVTNMPKIICGAFSSCFNFNANAHHYRFVGIEVTKTAGTYVSGLVSQVKSNHHITYDRCYLHGTDPVVTNSGEGLRRAITLHGNNMVVTECYISNCWEAGADTQALWWAEGYGWLIHNNYLEGAGENILTGGTSSITEADQPTDITVTKNTFDKPNTWWTNSVDWDGQSRTIKNTLEFKTGNRILVEANDFYNMWRDGQNVAIVYKSTDQNSDTPWVQVHNVTHRYNLHVGMHQWMGLTSNATSYGHSLPVDDVLIEDNLVLDINVTKDYVASGNPQNWSFLFLNDHDNIIIRHNTVIGDPSTGTSPYMEPNIVNSQFIDNIYTQGQYGLSTSGAFGNHTGTLNSCFAGTYAGNLMISSLSGNQINKYPTPPFGTNYVPQTINDVGFVNYQDSYTGNPNDYALHSTSTYKGVATDGDDPGCRMNLFTAARA